MDQPTWDPGQYHRFGDHRLRPALELFARVDLAAPGIVHDVGCGRGEIARLAAERWPGARVIGSDTSPEMLAAAAAEPSRVEWVRGDVRDWNPSEPPDLIYSNAVLHWVEGHEELFSALLRSLAPGGVLACQMPLSWSEPSHVLMRQALAARSLGSAELRGRYERPPVAEPAWYYDLLTQLGASVDLWVTRYYQQLSGDDPVLEWVKGTALRPILEGLPPDEFDVFLADYREALRKAYPPAVDGTTLYPFPRLFIVARAA